MTIKVRITFSDGRHSRSVPGHEVPFTSLTVGDMTDKVAETEAYLSRIMGLVVKIETGEAE
jgi:hypothetical protein